MFVSGTFKISGLGVRIGWRGVRDFGFKYFFSKEFKEYMSVFFIVVL